MTMNRNLIIPLILLDSLAAIMLALGLVAHFRPEIELVKPIVDNHLALPMMIVGGVLMLICGPLMIRWFLSSMRERGR